MKFRGSQNYVATQDLMLAVNAAITLQRPLLIKGEPGTGKTMLAEEVAQALGMPLLQWHIKSTTKAQQGLYEYDAVSRLRDSQLNDGDSAERVKDIRNYIVQGVLWQAFTADQPVALLIDEIDKADIEFPNDLLREIDRMEFYCYETRELIRAKHRPLVFITSNNEKELPTPSCAAASSTSSSSPEADTMRQIVNVHFPAQERAAHRGDEDVLRRAQPAGPEEEALHQRADRLAQAAGGRRHSARSPAKRRQQGGRAPLVGALLKNEQDVSLFEKLVFMNQRNR